MKTNKNMKVTFTELSRCHAQEWDGYNTQMKLRADSIMSSANVYTFLQLVRDQWSPTKAVEFNSNVVISTIFSFSGNCLFMVILHF